MMVESALINSLVGNEEDLPEWSEYLRRRGLVDYARARHERLQQHQLYLQKQQQKEAGQTEKEEAEQTKQEKQQTENQVEEVTSEPPRPAAAAAAAPTKVGGCVGVGGCSVGGAVGGGLIHWPTAGLCRGAPEDGSILGHVFCWMMVVSYVLFAVGLVIYMVRSIFYMKEMKKSRKETSAAQKAIFELVPLMKQQNGRTAN
jgi:hypothetical protein